MPDYSLGEFFPYVGEPYPLLRHVLDLRPEGYAVEFGVGQGVSLGVISSAMPAVGFDSFQGLPGYWRPGYPAGALRCRRPEVRNARIVEGWFADTLPLFDFGAVEPIGLAHFDADMYESTATALKWVGPHLGSGTFVVFDEWYGYGGCELHEQAAWREYVDANDVDWEVVGCSEQSWAICLA